MRYLIGHNDLVAGFVAKHIPHCERGFGDKIMSLGMLSNERMVAGVVYHNYNPERGTIELSGAAAGERVYPRTAIRLMHCYPFVDAKCQMIIMQIAADNARLLRQLKALGYKRVTVERLFGRDRDGVVATLTDDAWKANPIFHLPPVKIHQKAAA